MRYLAVQAGITQFIDIGTGIPGAGNVHEVAGQVAPWARVVYVDNDPIVHVHANALLTGTGTTRIVLADLRDPAAILAHPDLSELIDFTQPVALLLVAVVHFLTDQEDPAAIIATLRDALAPGSFLALSHGTADYHPPGTASAAAAVYDQAAAPLVLRKHPGGGPRLASPAPKTWPSSASTQASATRTHLYDITNGGSRTGSAPSDQGFPFSCLAEP